jgi:peptidoglycan/LPS O-acetylase OafA/YrhL
LYFGTANLPLLLFLNICVAVAVGNLSWHLVEKRFLKYKVFGLDKFAALRRTS